MHFSVRGYLEQTRPADLQVMMDSMRKAAAGGPLQNPMAAWDAAHYAATFGVSCEACHLGCQEHVASEGKTPPRFFPEDPQLLVESNGKGLDPGRTHDNVNWACGRCHIGSRPSFAAGMSTWNSVEYSDAMRGSCYSKLRCIDCHSPHKALGPKWSPPPERDDAVCLKCHAQYSQPEARRVHTHHAPGSTGDHCIDCHMPRINEGLNDVVRTHMIFSPTRTDMIQANHPNACNLCHTDKPIDWTLDAFKKWYGKTYDEKALARTYPRRSEPAALGWLASEQESVRLVAADALTRTKNRTALPQLLNATRRSLPSQSPVHGQGAGRHARIASGRFRLPVLHDPSRSPEADCRASRETPSQERQVGPHAVFRSYTSASLCASLISAALTAFCRLAPAAPPTLTSLYPPGATTRHDRRGRGSGHA